MSFHFASHEQLEITQYVKPDFDSKDVVPYVKSEQMHRLVVSDLENYDPELENVQTRLDIADIILEQLC